MRTNRLILKRHIEVRYLIVLHFPRDTWSGKVLDGLNTYDLRKAIRRMSSTDVFKEFHENG